MAKAYRDLIVWQRAIQLTLAVYRLSATFPREEMYGLTSQMRRAAVSIASNIAEGYGRGTRGEYKNFLGMARGSNFELQTQLLIARELGYGSSELSLAAERFSEEISKMLFALIDKLKASKVVVD
jgi:four helix bundle protein